MLNSRCDALRTPLRTPAPPEIHGRPGLSRPRRAWLLGASRLLTALASGSYTSQAGSNDSSRGSGSAVEHHLAKVRVAGSNPVFRSEPPGAMKLPGGFLISPRSRLAGLESGRLDFR